MAPLLEGEVFPVDTEKVFWRHIIGGLLSTRLQQAVLLNSIRGWNVKVLEVEGCRISVVRALVAEASGPGFDSRRQQRFFIFSFAFFQTPLGEKVSI